MRRIVPWTALGAVALATGLPARLLAQGFGSAEQTACLLGRGGAGVALSCTDGSAAFLNPANLTATTGSVLSVGGALNLQRGTFTDASTGIGGRLENRAYPVPNAFYARKLDARWAIGLGVFAPLRLQSEWPTSFQGRFLEYRSQLRAYTIQPTVAFAPIPGIRLGAGVQLNTYQLRLRSRLDLATRLVTESGLPAPAGLTWGNFGVAAGTDAADVAASLNSTKLGWTVGLTVQPIREVSIGGRYVSSQTADFSDGTAIVRQVRTGLVFPAGNPFGFPGGTPYDPILSAAFAPGSALSDQGVTTVLTTPDQFVGGIAISAAGVRLLADVEHTRWAKFVSRDLVFQRLGTVARPEGYRNTTTVRLGAEYDLTPRYTVRAGYWDAQSASPAPTPFNPEGRRSGLALGVGGQLTPLVRVDLAYQYLDQGDRTGRTSALPGVGTGLYTWKNHQLGATAAFAF